MALVGRVGTAAPSQIVVLVPKVNVGVMLVLTDTVTITGVEHNPAVGVKVYEPEFMLSITDGLQVPVMAFVDVFGSVGTLPPAQMDILVLKLNVGVMIGLTVRVNVAVVPH